MGNGTKLVGDSIVAIVVTAIVVIVIATAIVVIADNTTTANVIAMTYAVI